LKLIDKFAQKILLVILQAPPMNSIFKLTIYYLLELDNFFLYMLNKLEKNINKNISQIVI